ATARPLWRPANPEILVARGLAGPRLLPGRTEPPAVGHTHAGCWRLGPDSGASGEQLRTTIGPNWRTHLRVPVVGGVLPALTGARIPAKSALSTTCAIGPARFQTSWCARGGRRHSARPYLSDLLVRRQIQHRGSQRARCDS